MELKIVGAANLKQAQAAFLALTQQVEAFNAALAKSAMMPAGGTPQGFQKQQRALAGANAAFNAALASSGQFRVEQLKVNDVIAKQTELLKAQKLSIRETFGRSNRQLMRSMYREQLAMQNAVTKQHVGTVSDGRNRMALAVPTRVHQSWDSLNNRIGFFRHQLASSSAQLINWGKNTQWAGRQLMAGISMPVAAFGAAAGVMAYQVDKQMTRIAKVYDTTADSTSKNTEDMIAVEKELMHLREDSMETAKNAARLYGSSITETLEVQAELAATGQKGMALQKGTTEVMRIATLGEIDHATATQALIALQSTLGATVNETTNAFNLMNSIENATSLSTADFAAAIPRALGPMKEMSAEGSTAIDVMKNLSILMVAMKERGIEAGEGANAIKAMMQRLYRPSKQIREEWQRIAGLDPKSLVESSGGDIMKILPQIAESVKDLSKPERIQALAGLFGTYQVTRMSAMLEGFEDMEEGVGQTTRAMQINSQSIDDWAATAERESKRQRESAAGQFKIAWESLRAELADIGEPFLEVASHFLRAVSMIAKGFNSLGDGTKKMIVFGAIMAALVGPVVMLIGLFGNFAGNIGRFAAASLRLISNFELLNKNQWAAKAATELAAKGFVSQASAAQLLTERVQALNVAMAYQAQVSARASGIPLPPALQQQIATMGVSANPFAGNNAIASQIFSGMGAPASGSNKLQGISYGTFGAANLDAAYKTNELLDEHNKKYDIQQQTTKKISNNIGIGQLAMAGMLASSAGLMMNSGETAQHIAKWGMIASLVVPAAQILIPLTAKYLSLAKQAIAAHLAGEAAMRARATGGLASIAASGRATALAINAAMGPIGWTMLAITAAVGGLYYLHKRNENAIKAQIDQQKTLNNTAAEWAEAAGKTAGSYRAIRGHSTAIRQDAKFAAEQARLEYYRSGEGKNDANMLEAAGADDEGLQARKLFVDFMVQGKLSAEEARKEIEAMFMAIGRSKTEAYSLSMALKSSVGELKNVDWTAEIDNAIALIQDAGDDRVVEERAKNLAELFTHHWFSGLKPGGTEARAAWDQLFSGISVAYEDAFEQMRANDEGAEFLAERGITSAKELAAWYANAADAFAELGDSGMRAETVGTLNAGLEAARETERAIVGQVAASLGLSKEVDTINELMTSIQIQAGLLSWKDQVEDVKRMRDYIIQIGSGVADADRPEWGIERGMTQQEAEYAAAAALEVRLLANNLDVGATYAERLQEFLYGSKDEAEETAKEVVKVKRGLDGIPRHLSIHLDIRQNASDILRSGIEGVTRDLVDRGNEIFDNRMNSAIDNAQAGWDKRIDGQQAAQERQMAAFDARWERRREAVEKYYDARIKKVDAAIEAEQKAEETRQRIFEAEAQRLQRLAEMANRAIDFNVAVRTGDLDEAAKIRNDMDAVQSEWALGDAAKGSAAGSDKRLEQLENRKDAIEEQRERELKAIEKREAAERAHLERVHQMRSDALRRQADANMAHVKGLWEQDKKSFEDRLELFESLPAANEKQLKAALKIAGLTLDDFGFNKINPTADRWGNYFNTHLQRHVRVATAEIARDTMWEAMGSQVAMKTLRGMGFSGPKAFQTFIMTGKLPANFGKPPKSPSTPPYNPAQQQKNADAMADIHRHTGGWVGDQIGSRKGVARTLKGDHISEVTARLRKGEYVVDRTTAAKNAPLLESLGSGPRDSRTNKGHGVGGGGFAVPAMAAFASALAGRSVMHAVSNSLQNAYLDKRAQLAAQAASVAGQWSTGKAGMYSDRAFNATQLKHAATIANVGSGMGMSARDIMIGIMTAITESGLVNVNYGDRDSLGLFQQRPSMGWGTPEQVTNPEYASRKFFSVLRTVGNRTNMTPWAAAQAVQRSAYADGSNYRQYWDNAQAIFKNGLIKSVAGYGANTTQYMPGTGGWHKPSVGGKGWSNSHDYRNGIGSPLYAHADSTVVESRAITSGGSPGNGQYATPYRSYGETILLRGPDGSLVRYAHLNPGSRFVRAGQRVKGGALIGRSGMTGNATGPHTHFDINGDYRAREWFASHGIGLKRGGYTMSDGIANLHKEEVVIDPARTRAFMEAFDKVATGGPSQYNVNVNVVEPGASADDIANKVLHALKKIEARKPTRRRS